MLDLQAIIDGSNELAALPGSALRLTAILSCDDWIIDEIVHTIGHDQALTGRLLKLANSAASGAQCKVDTVADAVMRMGTGPVLSLAVGSAVREGMAGALPSFEEGEGALWRHSVASALAVQNAGRHCSVVPPAECFVAALLHDIGFLALDRWLMTLPNDQERFAARASIRETDHGVLGGLITAQWQLLESTPGGRSFTTMRPGRRLPNVGSSSLVLSPSPGPQRRRSARTSGRRKTSSIKRRPSSCRSRGAASTPCVPRPRISSRRS